MDGWVFLPLCLRYNNLRGLYPIGHGTKYIFCPEHHFLLKKTSGDKKKNTKNRFTTVPKIKLICD